MRILHLLTTNKYSGAENVVCQIIKMFDNEIEMAYCSLDGDIRNSLEERNITFLPIKKFNLKEIKKVIKDYNPDVVHCHDLKATILGSMIKNKVIISHIHGNKKNMSKLSAKSLLLIHAFKRVNTIFWVSNSCFETFFFKKSVRHKSVVLPNIISISDLIKKSNTDKKHYLNDIIYLGRLVYEKNPTRLIEIANLLKRKNNDFKMAIVGDGIYKKELETLIENYNLKENIKLYGFVSNPYKLLKSSKLMLMTSIMEGTPMCALESMGLGVPVVSTKTDGMVDLIVNGENGYLYDTNEQAVNQITKILSNKDCLKKSTEDFAKKYNDVLEYKKQIMNSYEI